MVTQAAGNYDVLASGWMQIRARAKQRRVELPLTISDHADWPQLVETIRQVAPEQLWVTHGREDALVHHAKQQGIDAIALNLLGYDEKQINDAGPCRTCTSALFHGRELSEGQNS